MLVLLVAEEKILAVKVGTSTDPAHMPCWPSCLDGLPALLGKLPCWTNCLFGSACLVGQTAFLARPALLACLPFLPTCLIGLTTLLAKLPFWLALSCWSAYLGSPCLDGLRALLANLPCWPICLDGPPAFLAPPALTAKLP